MPIDPKLLEQLLTRQATPENPIPLAMKPNTADFGSRYVTPDKVTSYYGMGDLTAYTKYGVPIYPWIPLDDWRAKNQSRQQQWGRAIVNTGNELVIGSLKGITDIPKMAQAYFGQNGLAAMADAEAHKDALTTFYENVKEKNQIYLEADERGFKPGKATWWAQGLPSTATAVSMLLPTMAAAKGVSYASKLLGAMSKSKAVTTGLKAVGVAEDALFFGKQGTALAATVGGALYGNAYESYLEIGQQLPQLKQQLVESGKFSPEEIQAILEQEADKIYKGNLPNAALDMLGIYTLLKPSQGISKLISTQTAKRVGNTLAMEAIPEGVQEGRNFFVSERAKANVDKLIGLREEGDSYDLNEFLSSGDAWTAMTFGAIGGGLFMGAGNMFRQAGENLTDKANIFRGLGTAAVSGLTTSEAKLAETQQEMIKTLKADTDKLLSLRSFAELAGNTDLYNKLTDRLTTAAAISHMAVGTYGEYVKNLQSVGQVLEGLEKEIKSQETVDENALTEIADLKTRHAKALQTTEAASRYYVKGESFYGLGSVENKRYINSSLELDEKTKELNTLLGAKQSLFSQDEFGILRSKRSKQVSELTDARVALETELAALSNYSTETAEQGKKNIVYLISELEQRINALRNSKDIDAISELAIAEKSLEVAKAKKDVIEVLDGTYTKKVKEKLAYIEKDPVLGKFVYGKDGLVDSLNGAITNASLAELRFNAVNSQIENAEDINIRQSLDELAKHNTGLTTESRNKMLSKVDDEIEAVKNSEEAAAITEVDNNTEAYEQLGVFRDSDDIIQDMLNTQIGTEAYNRIQQEITNRVNELLELKKAIAAIPDFVENTLTNEEIVNDYLATEIDNIFKTLLYIEEAQEDSPELVGGLIGYLENLKKFLKEPVEFSIDSRVAADLTSDIDQMLVRAEEISEAMYERLKQQDLQQEKKYNAVFQGMVNALKIAIPDFEGTTLKDIQDAINLIRKDSVRFKKVKEDIASKVEELEKELIRLGFKGQAYTKAALKFSPITSIFTLASEGKFLTPEFKVSLQSKDLKPEGKYLSAMKLMEEAIPYSELLRLIDNSISFEDILTTEQKLSTTSPALFPEQRAALYAFLVAAGSGRRLFYLQGVAGSGKTTVALNAFLKTLVGLGKLKQEQIFTMAKGAAVNNKVSKEVSGVASEIEWFTNQILDKDRLTAALKDKTFLVVDEIGKLSGKEFKQLHEAVDEINKTRTTDKIAILMTGDPNQMTGTSTIPVLDSYYHKDTSRASSTTVLPTLTISQRTNNARVISFQNRFLKAGAENVFTQEFNESHSPDHSQGVAISTSVKEFKDLLTKKAREGRDVAVIVETRAQVQEYSKIAGLRVYTVSDSQGLDFDEVFIDLLTYSPFISLGGITSISRYERDNKIFYTAISRAKNYVNLFSSSTNGITEVNLPEDQFAKEFKAQKFKDNTDDYAKHLTTELKAFGKTPAVTKQETKEEVVEEQELEEEADEIITTGTTIDEKPTEEVGENKPIPVPKDKQVVARTSKSKEVNPHYNGVKQVKIGDEVITFRRQSLIPGIEEIVYAIEKDGKLTEVANRHVAESTEIIAPFKHTYTSTEIEELKSKGMNVGTAKVSNAAPMSYNYNDTAEPIDDKFFDRIKSTFADFFKSENYVFTPSSITTHIFVATDANIDIENKVLEANKSSLRIGKENAPFQVKPGASYMRVTGTAKHATNNSTKTQIQYIPLEAKRLTSNSPDLVTLQSLVKETTEVEPLLSSLGFNYRYGRNKPEQVNIRGKVIESNEFEIFLNALRFTMDSNGNAVTYSPIDKVQELFNKINQAEPAQKQAILAKLNAINDLLYTTTRTQLLKLENAEAIKDSTNEFLTLSGTGVEILSHGKLKGLPANIYNAAKQAGFEVISRASTKDSPVEFRKTFEIAGTSEGKAVVYHVKVSIPLTKTEGGFIFEDNVVPRIEIFEQDFIDYQTYTKDKNNPVVKAKAVKRIRKHYLPDMPKRTNRVYNSTQGQLVDFGLIGTNTFNINLEATMVDFLTNGFAKIEQGPAQLALNRIAQNNKKIYLDNDGSGRFYNLQRFHTYPDAKGQYITSVTGLSLTSAKTDLNNTYVVTKTLDNSGKEQTNYLVKIGEDYVERSHGDQFELADMLPLLFQFNNGTSSANGGFGLRETTFSRQVSLINKADTLLNKEKREVKRNALAKYESSFNSVNETFVEFDEEVTEEAAPQASTDKKADIERTLYGTISGSIPLSEALPNGVYIDLGNGLFAYADKNEKIAAIVDKENNYLVSKSFWNPTKNAWQIPNQANLKDDAKKLGVDEATYIKKYQDAVDSLNIKYDAELAALDSKTTTSSEDTLRGSSISESTEKRRKEELESLPLSDTRTSVYNASVMEVIPGDKFKNTRNKFIPFAIVEAANKNDKLGGQTAKQISDRGGYSTGELNTLLPNWRNMLPGAKEINAKYDIEYIDAVKKGEITKEQAMQALEGIGRKNSAAYAEIAALEGKKETANEPVSDEEYTAFIDKNFMGLGTMDNIIKAIVTNTPLSQRQLAILAANAARINAEVVRYKKSLEDAANPIDKVKALMATNPSEAMALIFDLQTVYTSGKIADELDVLLKQLSEEDKLESADDEDIESLTKDNGIPDSNPLSRKEVIALVKSLVPDITEDEIMVLANEIVTNDGKKLSNNLGAVYQGVIYLLESQNATVDEQVVRHEVFHKLFGQYVPLTTRLKILEAARNTKAFSEWSASRGQTTATDSQVNEFLATAFQRYRLGKSSKNNIFAKLFNFLERIFIGIKKLYNRDAALIDELFLNLVSQKYVVRDLPSAETPSAFLKQVEDYFPEDSVLQSLKSYMMAVDIVKSYIDKYRNTKGEITYNETLGTYEGFKTDQVESIRQVAAAIRKELQTELSKVGIAGNEFVRLFNLNRKSLRPEINRIRQSNERAAILLHLKNPETIKQIVLELEGNSAEEYLKGIVEELRIGTEDTLGEGENLLNEVKSGGLYEEIVSNLNVNNALTLTSKVKQALTLIKTDNGKYLTFRFAYAKLLDLFINQIDVRADMLPQLLKLSETADPKTKAVLEFLKVLYETSHNTKVIVGKSRLDIPKGFEYRDNTFVYKGLEIKRSERAQEYYDRVIEELKAYNDPYLTEYFKRANISSTLDFYNFLKQIETVGEAADLYRQVAHRIASQVQNDPLVDLVDIRERKVYSQETGQDEFVYETYLKASKISPAGIQSNIKQSLRFGIEAFLTANRNNLTGVPVYLKNQSVNNLLTTFGLPKYVSTAVNPADANKVKSELESIIKTFPTDISKLDDYLDKLGDSKDRSLNTLSRLLSKSDDFLAALNYIDSRNNSRYIFVTGSWLYDTLMGLKDGINRIPEFLTTNNYIANNNIFGKNKLQTIHDVVAIDGMAKTINKQKDEYPSIKYQNFSPADFFQHRFYHGFLSTINRSETTPTYFQYTYIQSDRKSDVAAKINVLNFKELKEAYHRLQQYEVDRQALINSKAHRVANFNGYKSKLLDISFEQFLADKKKASKKDFLLMVEELINSNNYQISVEKLPQIEEAVAQLRTLNLVYPALETELKNSVKEEIAAMLSKDSKATVGNYTSLYVAFYAFYLQNYINGEFLNQLTFGDKAYAKSDVDLTKRMQGTQSPGDRQLIDPIIGNKRYSKAVVASDYVKSMGLIEDVKKIYEKLYRADINSTDAVTLVTPHTMSNIKRGTGNYHLQGHIKPVAFYVDARTGITHYIKTAAFEITNELAYAFPQLKEIRRQMESHGLTEVQKEQYDAIYEKVISDKADPYELFTYDKLIQDSIEYYIFESAYKVGRPLDLVQNGETIQDKHIVTIDNQYFRIQGDPLSDSTDISNTTQFNYFTNTNGLNEVESFQLYNLDAELMRQKFNLYNHKKQILNPDGTVNKAKVISMIKASLAKSPQDERMWDLLNNKVDINFPSIINRAVIGIASKHAKESVEIRHSGKKLVVQSALGITLYQIGNKINTFNELSSAQQFKAKSFENLSYPLKQALIQAADIYSEDTFLLDSNRVSSKAYMERPGFNTYLISKFGLNEAETNTFNEYTKLLLSSPNELPVLIPRRLKMRDGNNYTEVVVPAWWAKQLPKEVQERIKNGDLYSRFNTGMAVRIPTTGIHSSIPVKIIVATDTAINRIIAPEELVALHGSDFDVDSLFFMNREIATEEDLKGRVITFGDYTVKAGYLVGYDSKGNLDREFYNALVKAIAAEPSEVDGKPNKKKEALITLRIKYVLNSKVDNNLDLITADKNQRDMNTPISFEPFKLDPFAKFTYIDLIDSGKSLNEIFAKNLKSMPQEIIDLFKGQKASDFIDEAEFANGKLVITNKALKERLLASNVGLETKLKIIYEKQDLKQDRDINTVGDQMRFHQDNFGGKMGVGIQANAMKVLAYLMYGGKFVFNGKNMLLSRIIDMQYGKDGEVTIIHRDGEGNVVEETGKLSRPKVKLREVKTIVEDGEILYDYADLNFTHKVLGEDTETTYNLLERETKVKNHFVFELLDTIINGYIDNVKEQVTSVINANTITIDTIAFLTGIGFEFDSIGYLMNQPVIRDVTKSRLTYTSRIKEAKRILMDKLLEKDAATHSSIKGGSYKFVTSDKDNLDMLSKFKDMPFTQVVKEELTKDEILSQLAALNLLESAKKTTGSFFPINRVLKLLQSFPVTLDEMAKTEEAIEFIKAGRLPFESDNLLQIPHIAEAISQFESMYDIVKQSIYLANPRVQEVLAEVKENTVFSTKATPSPINAAETMKELTNYFQGFLLNYLIEREDMKGYFDNIKEYVGIDNVTGELVKKANSDKVQYKSKRRVKEDGKWLTKEIILEKSAVTTDLSVEELWIQQFVLDVQKIRQDSANPLNFNTFFSSFVPSKAKNSSLLNLKYTKGSGADIGVDAQMRKGFLEMDAELQKKFTLYAILQDKGKFGFDKFTNYIPSTEGTGDLNNIKVASDLYVEEMLERLLIPKEDAKEEAVRATKLRNILEYFEYELVRTTGTLSRNPFNKSKKLPTGKWVKPFVVDSGVSSAVLKSAGLESQGYRVYKGADNPKWFVNRDKFSSTTPDIYMQLSVVEYEGNPYTIYKKVGKQDQSSVFKYNSYWEDHSFIEHMKAQSAITELSTQGLENLAATGAHEYTQTFANFTEIKNVYNLPVSIPYKDGFIQAYRNVRVTAVEVKEVEKTRKEMVNKEEIEVTTKVPLYKYTVNYKFSTTPEIIDNNETTDNTSEVPFCTK